MTKEELARQAAAECCNPETTTRYGVKRGNPFWNVESQQFMYVPAFHFTAVRGFERYRYDAVDEAGVTHSFEAEDCCELLTPIWAELPEGVVRLTVTAVNPDGTDYGVVGARIFYRLSPFPGDTPPKVRSYRESAIMAYKYAMGQSFMQYWLKNGVPDPSYDLNTYPSKMIGALVEAMLSYARLCPEDAADAMQVAVNAADYLIRITPRGDVPLHDLPLTYSLEFCPDPEKYGILTPNWYAAVAHNGTMMMKYPATAGKMYLELEEATHDEKYLREAIHIGDYYAETVEPCGSWFLVRSCETGEALTKNYVSPLDSVEPFLMMLYKRTGDEKYRITAEKSIGYIMNTVVATYNWEGQFEDSPLSASYMNLTHYGATALVRYLTEFKADDPQSVELAKELMRFVEDQFVIWKRPYPWAHQSNMAGSPRYRTDIWTTPCGLEQYGWYVPIDASAVNILGGFMALYKVDKNPLYLAKARALCDQLTRVQHENGQIPTHWMHTQNAEDNFWFNCMFESCEALEAMVPYENIEF